MTENTNTTSNATTKATSCKCYERGREDMRNAVLKLLGGRVEPFSGLDPLSVANFAFDGQLNERTPWQKDMVKSGYGGGFLLGDLVKACGADFVSLGTKYIPWVEGCMGPFYATTYDGPRGSGGRGTRIVGDYETPEEAVAQLWLKLNAN